MPIEPVPFPECNNNFDPPPNSPLLSIPYFAGRSGPDCVIVTKWRLSNDILAQLNETGYLYLVTINTLPAVKLSVQRPSLELACPPIHPTTP